MAKISLTAWQPEGVACPFSSKHQISKFATGGGFTQELWSKEGLSSECEISKRGSNAAFYKFEFVGFGKEEQCTWHKEGDALS